MAKIHTCVLIQKKKKKKLYHLCVQKVQKTDHALKKHVQGEHAAGEGLHRSLYVRER